MKKRLVTLLSALLLISCLTGCSVTKVELDEPTITSYLESTEVSDDVKIIYEQTNGVNYLSDLNDTAHTKVMTTWVNVSGHCELKGKLDGVWIYGFGTSDTLFYGVSENNKDALYEIMDGYKAQFEEKK